MKLNFALPGIVVIALAGCAAAPATNIKQPLTAQPPAAPAAMVNNGSIYQPPAVQPRGPVALFEDRRARYVGDTLTVNLVERTSASRRSETTENRKASADINIPGPRLLGSPRGIGATVWAPEAESKQEFKDNDTNSNTISGAIAVTVIEVLGNGNLRVAGEKQIGINNDTEYIRLAGVVNPAHISAANTINSTQLAEAQIESKNSQGLSSAQVVSMLARFFLTVLPF